MKTLKEEARRFHVFHKKNRLLFKKLENQQHPNIVFISCSDSRVDPLLLTGGKPGDVFVVRTAGNMIPNYDQNSGEGASVEYALNFLPIRQIIVCGHSNCGAMAGALNPDAVNQLPKVRAWLREPAINAKYFNPNEVDKASRENIRRQVANLKTYPIVREKLKSKELLISGWFYDIGSGEVQVN